MKENARLKLECDKCNKINTYNKSELDLDFEIVGTENMPMGIECQYQFNTAYTCDCGNTIEITFDVWEYPIGVQNCDDVTVDGAKLLEPFPLFLDFSDHQPEDSCDQY